MKWVKFSRAFNFIPRKLAAVTIQHSAGAVAEVTDEHAEKAVAAGAAVLIEPPANATEAAALRSGEVAAVETKPAKPAVDRKAPPAST